MSGIRVAIVGCGSAAQELHLPAVSRMPGIRLEALVDPRLDAAARLAAEYGARRACADYRDVIAHVDAVVLAVPNHLHAPLAADFLRAGVHVLVEKPMAPTVEECDRMIAVAEDAGAVLAVGLVRRFYHWTTVAESLVRGEAFGRVRRLTMSEGERYRQRVQSDFRFRRDESGGGVLADRGVHILDVLAWWLGDCRHVEYEDDAEGGVEAECRMRLSYDGDVTADACVTRLRDVPSCCRVDFDRASLIVTDAGSPAAQVRVALAGVEWTPASNGGASSASSDPWGEAFARQLADFVAAIRDGREPAVPGREGKRSVEMLERCYATRGVLEHPWESRPA